MSENDVTMDPKTRMHELLDEVDSLRDDIELKKAESKVALRKFDRIAKQFSDIAKAVKAERGIEDEDESDDADGEKPKRGRKATAG